ncbi:SixA phosphatase family protein [Kribbella deserti]|uniref:Histidine phosphatase family protein n=1 Tax=Kribbella deserti TaxID=1926257 RepID=A0ABV6QIJ2_9ACTN
MADPTPAPAGNRLLVLLRHAKAVPPESMADLERPLAPRGRADAAEAGKWLAEQGIAADLVLCSPAERTRETWQYAANAGASAGDVWFDRRIYNAYPESLLEVLRDVPAEARTVIVVGHAPGIPWLADELAAPAETEARTALTQKYPTTGLAVLQHNSAWPDLTADDATLLHYVIPRA